MFQLSSQTVLTQNLQSLPDSFVTDHEERPSVIITTQAVIHHNEEVSHYLKR